MATNPLPYDSVREIVFKLFCEQWLGHQPTQGRKSDRDYTRPIEGTISQGCGPWFAVYEFNADRWTRLFHRDIDPKNTTHYPSINLIRNDQGRYEIRSF